MFTAKITVLFHQKLNCKMKKIIKSPLRYPGGKSRAIPQILPLIPANITEFREPFVGGGSVFFAMKSIFGEHIQSYWINDVNKDLYCFWRYARDANEDLVRCIEEYKNQYHDGRKLHRYWLDEANVLSDFDRAVRFFIMNRITFSGTVDSGGYSQGAFKGRFTDSSIQRLRDIYHMMQGVKITNLDYTELLKGEGGFIFLDPPYYSATHSKLYGKKGDLHTHFDHERFAQEMKLCRHSWLITYDDSSYIRELFNWATIIEWTLQYGMNNYKQNKASSGKELFVLNYTPPTKL